MFTREYMSVGDWWLFWLLMAIPLVNIIFFIIILASPGTNKSLKNYLIASIIPAILIIMLVFVGFIIPAIGHIIDQA